jgi:hypothetical protein
LRIGCVAWHFVSSMRMDGFMSCDALARLPERRDYFFEYRLSPKACKENFEKQNCF